MSQPGNFFVSVTTILLTTLYDFIGMYVCHINKNFIKLEPYTEFLLSFHTFVVLCWLCVTWQLSFRFYQLYTICFDDFIISIYRSSCWMLANDIYVCLRNETGFMVNFILKCENDNYTYMLWCINWWRRKWLSVVILKEEEEEIYDCDLFILSPSSSQDPKEIYVI